MPTYSSYNALGTSVEQSELNLNIRYALVPIGAILPWAGNFTSCPALPSAFMECDGSVINDASSPMDGETLPDLNGNNSFMRGDATSGNIGGSETHNHQWKRSESSNGAAIDSVMGACAGVAGASWNAAGNVDDWDDVGGLLSTGDGDYTAKVSTLPTYYSVRWIMRIK